jgi:acetylornithine deacetylase
MNHINDKAYPVQDARLLQLLRRLIDIYSPSGKEEALLGFLHGFFKRRQLPVQRQMLADGRYNLILAPAGVDIEVALLGHVDTVSAYDLEEVGFSQQNDHLCGLGAADMKGGCAALIEAWLGIWESGHHDWPVALVLVVGEEENGDGTARLLEEYYFPWAIIAEPTQLAPCLAHYGYIEMQLTTRGLRRHASLAKGRINPVESMLKTLLSLTHHLETDRSEAVYNIRDLLTAQSGFAVPEWCQCRLDLHLPPHANTGEICTEFEEVVKTIPGLKEANRAEVRYYTIQDGYALPEKGTVVEALQKVFLKQNRPWKPAAFPSHSDANSLWARGVKPILLGPGSLAKAHAPDESIDPREVVSAARIYHQLLYEMFDH